MPQKGKLQKMTSACFCMLFWCIKWWLQQSLKGYIVMFAGACMFCHGICLRWWPHDAYTQWCLHGVADCLLCRLCGTWSAVLTRKQDCLQVGHFKPSYSDSWLSLYLFRSSQWYQFLNLYGICLLSKIRCSKACLLYSLGFRLRCSHRCMRNKFDFHLGQHW